MQITAPCRFESLSAARPREGPVRERLGAGPSPSRKVPRRPPRSGHVCDHPGEEEKKASPHETKPRRRRGRARWSRTVRGEACKHAVRANQPNDRRHRPDSDPGRCSCPSVRQARHTSTARLPRWLESCASAPRRVRAHDGVCVLARRSPTRVELSREHEIDEHHQRSTSRYQGPKTRTDASHDACV
jgi:hypothetical protein